MARFVSFCLLCVLCILFAGRAAAADKETTMDIQEPQITLGYIYISCNDIVAMHHFYVELIGLDEQAYKSEGQIRWLVCRCRGFELMFFAAEDGVAPVIDGWHAQPGWEGGTVEGVSWSIEVPAELYAETVQRLKADGVPCFFDKPQWLQDNYWGFPVKDPMGNTVEVFNLPKERPEQTEWQQ